jgi:adenylate cyclase
MDTEQLNQQMWNAMLHGEFETLQRYRTFFKILPSNPRCSICNAPFEGFGGRVVRTFMNRKPSGLNPRYCNACEHFAEQYPGGAEVEITMLFADVRGSTTIAENMNPSEFRTLLNRFYKASTNILVESNSWID